uniref:Hydroxyacid oxidase n=1 Tax=Cardiosporidium cionae TaxID=476202 RepID=A0A3Q8UBE6_9APIC|nr:hydroxyacid oxidase [Cardiosporidium cionae]
MANPNQKQNLVCLDDFEERAKSLLPKSTLSYYSSGADDQITLRENRSSLDRIQLLPRVLRDVSTVSLETRILGHTVAFPFGIAPTAFHKLAAPDGEISTAKAATEANTCMTLSSFSNISLEDVAEACNFKGLRFFQSYILKDTEHSKALIKRAELAGYKAIVLTVDTPVLGIRREDERVNFGLPDDIKLANFSDLISRQVQGKDVTERGSAFRQFLARNCDSSLTWDSLAWLKANTSLPIVLKGILSPEDALLAVKYGVQAVWVSNHGARQLDGVPATIECLPAIRNALRGSGLEIYIDGGFRRGTDVLKALALGANYVFLGRPILWGLTVGQQKGVSRVIELMRIELERAMRLCGATALEEIVPAMLLLPQSTRFQPSHKPYRPFYPRDLQPEVDMRYNHYLRSKF